MVACFFGAAGVRGKLAGEGEGRGLDFLVGCLEGRRKRGGGG